MGQEYNLKLFYETGFDRYNRPDSLGRLDGATMKVFASPYLRQDKFIQSIKIDASFTEVEGADYAVIGSSPFFVTGVVMIADHTAQVSLEYDEICAVGVSNIQVVGGWVKRRHVAVDTPFTNDINEPFQPREHLQIDEGVEVGFTGTNETVVASTLSLRNKDLEAARTYMDNSQNLTVTVPDVSPVPYETVCVIPSLEADVTREYKLPMTLLFRNLFGVTNVDIQSGIGALRALGLENAITASYLIPIDAFNSSSGSTEYLNEVERMIGLSKEEDSGLDFVFGSYKNKKVYMGQYTHYTIANIATGNQADFMPEDIYFNENSMKVTIYADPCPTGKPFCRPKHFRKNKQALWMASIAGAPWLNAPIRFEEGEISGFSKHMKQVTYTNEMINASLEIAELQAGLSLLGGSVGNITDGSNGVGWGTTGAGVGFVQGFNPSGVLTGGLKSVASLGMNSIGMFANRDISAEMARLQKNRNIQSVIDLARPEIIFPMSDNMAAYYGHKFIVYRTRMTNSDMARFDKFLTMYGYAVDEPFTGDALTCRQKFNYITLQDAQIKIPGFGVSIRERVTATLAAGVRIWHKLPAPEDYNDNPIVEVS